MSARRCAHVSTTMGAPVGYDGTRGAHYTDRRATGGVERRETCSGCGAHRWHATTGRHSDASPWYLHAASAQAGVAS